MGSELGEVLTGFIDGIGTVRACLDCGVLVAGGPTRCTPCARAAFLKGTKCPDCGGVMPLGNIKCMACVRREEAAPITEWRELFAVPAIELIQTCRDYMGMGGHDLASHRMVVTQSNHNFMAIISQMAACLDEAQDKGYRPSKERHGDHV